MAIKRSTGLVDKLNGIRTNLVSNGTFDTDTTGWSGSLATLTATSGGVTNNLLQVANSASAAGYAYTDITTVVGRVYKVTFNFKKGTGVSGTVKIGTTSLPQSVYVGQALTDADWAYYEIAFIATATTTRLSLANNSVVSSETSFWDIVVVEEILDGFTEIMRGCKVNFYTAPQPANADAAATGTLLCTVTVGNSGTGLTFNPSNNGVVSKPSGVTWSGMISVPGGGTNTATATWFRVYESGDDPSMASTVFARIDGSVGLTGSGADMIAANNVLTNGLLHEITGFNYTPSKG